MISKELSLKNRSVIKINILLGSVLQGETWTSTHVSSSGGGGNLHNGSGYIFAPTVHSHTTTHQSVWIKEDDSNKDVKLSIPSYVDAMHGHKLKSVELFYENRFIDIIYIENLTTEKYWTPLKIESIAEEVTQTLSISNVLLCVVLSPVLWWAYIPLFLISFSQGKSYKYIFYDNNKNDAADLVRKINYMIKTS